MEVYLTKDNYEKPWILFEAGALARGLETNRVCTLLIDEIEIKQPLERFQYTSPSKAGMLKLIQTINNHVVNKLSEDILLNVFTLHWPQFEEGFSKISKAFTHQLKQKREIAELLEELILTVRSFDKRLYQLELEKNDTTDYKKHYNDFIKTQENKMREIIINDIKQGVPMEKTFDTIRNLLPLGYDIKEYESYYLKLELDWTS